MINLALGFVFGAWLLQQQANLPDVTHTLGAALILGCSLVVFIQFKHHLVKKSAFSCLLFCWDFSGQQFLRQFD
jgi:hypothetical protein